MKFLVSEYDLSRLPPGTVTKKETLTYLDYRTAPTLEEAKKCSWYRGWKGRGKNHRGDKVRGMVVCEVPQEEFVVEVESLQELVELLNKMDYATITRCDYLEVRLQIRPDSE